MNSMLLKVTVLTVILHGCFAPPVTPNKKDGPVKEEHAEDGMADYMEYHRYLREVVSALESDPEFRSKLEGAKEEDIRSGKIAHELEFVSHHIRTRLDEIKRTELDRLRELMQRKMDLMDNNSIDDPLHNHLDHSNQHTFEIEDLKKLIAKTTEDLAEADRKRREEFKEYELQKEYEKQQKLNHTNGDDREKLEHEFIEKEQKHKKHEKLHEPGHKQQLEQVWEEQDQMQQDFDPKTFFMLHDLDSNGLWDETEVKALFIKELDKMYQPGEPEDDMRERAEEMERMRESVMTEVDLNKDGFIDYSEFLAQTKRNDYQQDNGWQGLDEQKQFTDDELQEYIRQHQAQQYPIQGPPPQGMHPSQVQPGYHQSGPYQVPPSYHPNDIHPPQAQLHPGQLPQVQTNPQQLHYQQVPPQVNPQFPGGNQAAVPNLNTNEVYPNQAQQVNPNQGQYQQVNPNQGQYQQVNPNQGQYQQVNPNQAQYQPVNTNQVHQQVNPNQGQYQQVNTNQGQQRYTPNQGQQQQQQQNQGQGQQLNQGQQQLNQGQQIQSSDVAPKVQLNNQQMQNHPNINGGGQVPLNQPNQIPQGKA